MRFIKGILIGGAIGAGVAMMFQEGMIDRKKMMKKGKQIAKTMGIM